MFSNGYVVWRVRRERCRDRLREAERYRLLREACLARRRQDQFYGRALIWLGRCLVQWGLHLQERYAALADSGLLRAADQGR